MLNMRIHLVYLIPLFAAAVFAVDALSQSGFGQPAEGPFPEQYEDLPPTIQETPPADQDQPTTPTPSPTPAQDAAPTATPTPTPGPEQRPTRTPSPTPGQEETPAPTPAAERPPAEGEEASTTTLSEADPGYAEAPTTTTDAVITQPGEPPTFGIPEEPEVGQRVESPDRVPGPPDPRWPSDAPPPDGEPGETRRPQDGRPYRHDMFVQVNEYEGPPEVQLITEQPADEWLLPAGDYANTRYSVLDQINTENAGNLKLAWSLSTGIPHGHEGQPLVVDDTMYIVTPYPNMLLAVDLKDPSGPLKFMYNPYPDSRAVGVACCDVVNRGASYADGKIFYTTLDTTVVAVDAETGDEVWRNKIGNPDFGETSTMAALVVKDKVLVGNSGGELGVRGKLTALNIDTGEIEWIAYSTGPDEEVLIGEDFDPFYEKDEGEDLGVKTWPPDQWKLGGGTVWGWISYDPELDLIYHGTGNPGVWNPDLRPGANKWSLTIWARDPDDGSARWAYQVIPHDSWDYDEIMESVLVDMEWEGEMRQLMFHPARNGFMMVMDRTTGQLLSAETYQPVNWATGYDLDTGLPNIDETKRAHMGQVTEEICPSSTGAKEFVPSAFSPRTGLLYIPAHNTCMNYEGIEASYIAGTPYLGASVRMYPGPGDYQGELVAWDVKNARQVWGIKDSHFPIYSGVLATAGDVVFYGTMTGWFKAVHALTGEQLWEMKLGSGIVGNPMTFMGPDGKQYVAIYSGIGGWMGTAAFPSRGTEDEYAMLGAAGAMKGIQSYTLPGNTLYVFSL